MTKYPNPKYQRCWAHKTRNVLDTLPKSPPQLPPPFADTSTGRHNMEILRRILSRLVKDGGHFVEMKENQRPLLHLGATTQTLETFDPLSAAWIRDRVAEILPREAEAYQAGRPVEGRLVIKTVGALYVLAIQYPHPCLVLFMPNFDIELERYKKKLPQLEMELATQSFPEIPSLDIRTQQTDRPTRQLPPPPVTAPRHEPLKSTPIEDLFAAPSTPKYLPTFSPREEKTILPLLQLDETELPTKMHLTPYQENIPSLPQKEAPNWAPDPFPAPVFTAPAPTLPSTQLIPIDYAPVLASIMSWSQGNNAIDRYLREVVESQASDLHLTTGQPMAFRKDGDIKKSDVMVTPALIQSLLDPIIPTLQRNKFASTWDIDFAYEVGGLGRFRANLFREQGGIGAVLRHIPQTILTTAELELPATILKFGKLTKGLILVTGPTGSGKTTTLAALIESINQEQPLHIMTIEDPIEFTYHSKKALIRQREVGKHTESFAAALRAVLREDPDIVLIGELRDAETTAIAIETAETGHLVFATLHTNSAVSTINRIIDQFPNEKQPLIRSMLAASLKGVVTQTLVKKIGGGRCAAVELLLPDDAVASMIREGKTQMIENHMQTQKANGNQLLNEALLQLALAGTISSREAWLNSLDRKSLEEMAKRKNLSFLES